MEVQFFGAVTLPSKLAKNWQEVPENMHNELKEKLLQKIVEFGGAGTKLVLNRLSMCVSKSVELNFVILSDNFEFQFQLSTFIVHMLKEWPSAINDVINMFQNQQLPNITRHTQFWILFDVLSGVPEESTSSYSVVHRGQLRNEVYKNAPQVLKTIIQFIDHKCEQATLEDEDITLLQNVAKCCQSWFLKGSIPLDECIFITATILKLVSKIYWAVLENDGCLSPDESELAESCLKSLSNMMIQPDSHKYSNTSITLMKMFLESLSPIVKNEWKMDNLNEDIAFCIYSLFITCKLA